MKKYFAISDIHGRNISMQDFIDKGFDKNNENHYIVIVGDWFDGGNNIKSVYRFLRKGKDELKDRFIILRGNHEEDLLVYLSAVLDAHESFLPQDIVAGYLASVVAIGGLQTVHDLLGSGGYDNLPDYDKTFELATFIEDSLYSFETKDYLFTHAAYKDGEADLYDITQFISENETDKTMVVGHLHHRDFSLFFEKERNYKYGFNYYYEEDEKILNIADTGTLNIVVLEENLD